MYSKPTVSSPFMPCDYMPTKPAPKFGPKPKKLDFTKGIKGQSSRRKAASKVKF